MESGSIVLKNVKVGCHGEITANVINLDLQTEYEDYLRMVNEMNLHYSNDQMVSLQPYQPQQGEICAGKLQNLWFRVQVKDVLRRKNGQYGSCYLVDEGTLEVLPMSGLKHLPSKFRAVPFQVKNIVLDKIQPLSMIISGEDLSVHKAPKKRWDEAAIKFMQDIIPASTEVKCNVMSTLPDGSLSVLMYLRLHTDSFECLNEQLVSQNFACKKVQPDDKVSQSCENSIEEFTRSKRQQYYRGDSFAFSDSENVAARSDTECASIVKSHLECEVNDKAYTTDIQGVSTTSHGSQPCSLAHGLPSQNSKKPCVASYAWNGYNLDRFQDVEAMSSDLLSPFLTRCNIGCEGNHCSISDEYNIGGVVSSHKSNGLQETICHSCTDDEVLDVKNDGDEILFSSSDLGLSCNRSELNDINEAHARVKGLPAGDIASLSMQSDDENETFSFHNTFLTNGTFLSRVPVATTHLESMKVSPKGRGTFLFNVHNFQNLSRELGHVGLSQNHSIATTSKSRPTGTVLSLSEIVLQTSGGSSNSENERCSNDKYSVNKVKHVHSPITDLHNQRTPNDDATTSCYIRTDIGPSSSIHPKSSCTLESICKLFNDNRPEFQVLSRSESSASNMCTITAPMKGQADTFIKSRLPKQALLQSQNTDVEERKSSQQMKPLAICDIGHLDVEADRQQTHSHTQAVYDSFNNVLVHGGKPPRPYFKVEDAHFIDHLKQSWDRSNFASPTLVQSYAWPMITRGRHVMVLSPKNTGKTIAYLYPLISSLSDHRLYKELLSGLGPYLIILTKTWRQAEYVYHMAINAVDKGLQVLLVHGGGQEENKAITLLNGCEILVTTPRSFKRILDLRYTDLRRLCHLVIDDADQILKVFTKEIISIMEQYFTAMKNLMKTMEIPRQILLFGTQWNDALRSFMEKFLVEPVLIITSLFEASIYGKVKQIPYLILNDQRLQTLLRIVMDIEEDENSTNDKRTIIFVSNTEDIKKVYKTLHSQSICCSMVYDGMDLFEVQHVMEGWPMRLLVCCDSYVSEMGITDATNIIHYDIPNSKTKFSNRLGCMKKYFYDFSRKEQLTVEPTSHVIITETCENVHLKAINELLERSNCFKSPKWNSFFSGRLQACEEDDTKELCSQLLAYGICRDKLSWQCPYRHLISPEVDNSAAADWLPVEGEVKVVVTHIFDASHYCVRLLSVRNEDKSTRDFSPIYCQIQMELSLWYSKPSNRKRYVCPCAGDLCGYQENDLYYRVKILNVVGMDELSKGSMPPELEVKLIDSGRTEEVPVSRLYILPEKLKEIPFQAIEVYICKVQPLDKDNEWTPKASTFIYESLHRKTLTGKIVLRLGDKMWLDPLVLRVHMGESNSIINKFYVHTELIRNGLADENLDHLKKLQRLFEGKVKIPNVLLLKTKMSPMLDTDVLPAIKETHEVFVSSVTSPELFFLQRTDRINDLEVMMKAINDYIRENEEEDSVHEIEVGKYCLAQYMSFDKRWYRCRILTVDEDSYEVFFTDYGDRDTVAKDKIREMPVDKFFELPLLAIECTLDGVVSLASESSIDKAGDIMWDLSHFVNNDLRPFLATVHKRLKSKYAGRQKFVVDLACVTEKQKFNMAEELLWSHLVMPLQNCKVKPLFMKLDVSMMRLYSSPLEKVAHMCTQVYWQQEENKAMYMVEDIRIILSKSLYKLNSVLEDTAMEVLKCLVKLIGRVQWASVHHVILECLLYLARSGERFCQELIQENCVFGIVRCLEMNSDTDVQNQAADFIAQAVQLSSRVKDCYKADENITVLMELFESTECPQIEGAVCRAFAALCCESQRVFDYLMNHSICQKLAKCLRQVTDHEATDGALMLISDLANHDSGHKDLMKESLMEAILINLHRTDCNKCIHLSVQQCDRFAAVRRKHKTFLLEHQIVPLLKRILQLNLEPNTSQLCEDLMTSLVIRIPLEPLEGHALKGDMLKHMSSNSGGPPEIHWAQNSFRVMLNVNVPGVKGSAKDIVSFTPNAITFRANVSGIQYGFSYKLFDSIIVDKSHVEIKSHKVLISMKKSAGGKWNRLLHDKHKPPNLSLDFERFVDSSSDSETCKDDEPFVFKKKTKGFKVFENAPTEADMPILDNETETDDSLENLKDSDDIDHFDMLT